MSAPTATAPAARCHGLSKHFGEVRAVDGVDLTVRAGEIHALLGENGAGKTTLMCMFGGLCRPDAGGLELFGRQVLLRSPRDAMAASVGMVHQHFMLVPTLTVAENVLLGAARLPALLRLRRLTGEVQREADRLGLAVRAEALLGSLSVGEQQRVEILRVLSRGARLMILDEPTAVLSPAETEALFESLRRLVAQGCAVVLISHKLQELRQVADRITVMRRGRVVAGFDDPRQRSAEELAAAMVGRDVSLEVVRPPLPRGPALLRIRGLCVRSRRGLTAVRDVDLEVHRSEIVGLAAVSGNGQTELMDALSGLRPITSGTLILGDREITRCSTRERAARGLRYIPEDRYATGTAPSLSVAENLALRRYREPPARRGPWLRLRALHPHAARKVAELRIATDGLEQEARLLSGGNLQKVVLAREVDEEAQLILAMHPTRGLDAWATAEVHRQLLAARARGAALLLCSEDLDEILALSDRIAVMSGGRLVHLAERDSTDRITIGRFMAAG